MICRYKNVYYARHWNVCGCVCVGVCVCVCVLAIYTSSPLVSVVPQTVRVIAVLPVECFAKNLLICIACRGDPNLCHILLTLN